jgi:recombination protein RecA
MYIQTGCASLDLLLKGGYRRGLIVDVQGKPGSGKTTLAEHAVRSLDSHENALWIPLGTEAPTRCGNVAIARPESAEDVFTVITAALTEGASLIVVDSANGLVRQREIDNDPSYVHDTHREYKFELGIVKTLCAETGGTVMFLSMPRANQYPPIRGTGITEKAGQSIQLYINSKKQDGTTEVQASTRNGDYTTFEIKPGSGIDWAADLLRMGVHFGLVNVKGSWYYVDHTRVQGFDTAVIYIRQNPQYANDLYETVMFQGS